MLRPCGRHSTPVRRRRPGEQAEKGWTDDKTLGLIVAFAGWGLFSGRTWARTVAIILAVLSAIANFAFIPYYPFWSLLIITLDIFVIWAVAAHGGAMRDPV
jgi:galactitol-specific phosphotransferase system IIC component